MTGNTAVDANLWRAIVAHLPDALVFADPEGIVRIWNERAEMLAALACVDHVFVFDDPTVDALLESIRPTVYCKGPEYTIDTLPESATVRRLGIQFRQVGDPKDHSTTDLIRRIRGESA